MEENTETLFLDKNGVPKNFVCDICGCATKVQFEGAEPNTCEMCMPLEVEIDNEDCTYYHIGSRHFDYDE